MGRAAGFTARARVSAAGGSGALQPLSDEQCKSVTMTFLLTVSEVLPGAGEALLGVKERSSPGAAQGPLALPSTRRQRIFHFVI